VDLSGLRCVEVDAQKGTATVGGGVSVGEVLRVARPYGLATPTGTVRGVG